MIPVSNVVAFCLAAIPLIMIPGPTVLFVIGRSLALGRAGGLLSVVGNAIGALVIAIAVALGVGVLVEQSELAFTIIKFAGAGYLIFLGIQAIRHRHDAARRATAETGRRSNLRLLKEGFVVGITNPKTLVFLIAVLPQFVDYPSGDIPIQLAILGALFVAIALVSDGTWALAAGVARHWFARSPTRLAALSAIGGMLIIAIGITLLFVAKV